jgi:uncharacterized membrane protein YgdD (TMEM256/DUF423 family)
MRWRWCWPWLLAVVAADALRSVCFALGIVLFSGSLYALALGAPRWTGIITPFGGLAFIIGWIALGLSLVGGRWAERPAEHLQRG